MAKIKFTHAYKKLMHTDADGRVVGGPIKQAKLLLVVLVSNDQIRTMKDFIEYDTDNGRFTIPYATYYLLLIFQKPSGDLFTSVRSQWGSVGNKKPYYDNLVGQTLDVVVTSEVMHHA